MGDEQPGATTPSEPPTIAALPASQTPTSNPSDVKQRLTQLLELTGPLANVDLRIAAGILNESLENLLALTDAMRDDGSVIKINDGTQH